MNGNVMCLITVVLFLLFKLEFIFVKGSDNSRRQLRCVDMVKLHGHWHYNQTREIQSICGIYFIGETDELLKITITNPSLDCEVGEYIEIFDGWMTYNGVLPESEDHVLDLNHRFISTCGETISLTASQNFALVQFRLLLGSTFALTFERVKTNSPCHVISPTPSGKYTLSSDDHTKKCTFSIIYPSCITISQLSMGLDILNRNETTTAESMVSSCVDKLDVLKGDSLDLSRMTVVASYRGPISWNENRKRYFALNQSHSAIRISTTGRHRNSAVIKYSKLGRQESHNTVQNSSSICK